jgi:RNA polymerase sigma factor (sigma-70 family)
LTISEYIANNYQWLLGVAGNFVRTSRNKKEDRHDLLHISIEEAMKRLGDKQMEENECKAYMISFMSRQTKWTNTDFKIQTWVYSNDLVAGTDESTNPSDLLFCETINNEFKDFIKENIQDFGLDKIKVILQTKLSYRQLSLAEKTLFDLYFVKDMTMRQISEILGISLKRTFVMINKLKDKIKSECNIHLK